MGEELAESIERNTLRYMDLFCTAIDSLMPTSNSEADPSKANVVDVILSHRLAKQSDMEPSDVDPKKLFPPALLRK